jgi:hypothetical protein
MSYKKDKDAIYIDPVYSVFCNDHPAPLERMKTAKRLTE